MSIHALNILQPRCKNHMSPNILTLLRTCRTQPPRMLPDSFNSEFMHAPRRLETLLSTGFNMGSQSGTLGFDSTSSFTSTTGPEGAGRSSRGVERPRGAWTGAGGTSEWRTGTASATSFTKAASSAGNVGAEWTGVRSAAKSGGMET